MRNHRNAAPRTHNRRVRASALLGLAAAGLTAGLTLSSSNSAPTPKSTTGISAVDHRASEVPSAAEMKRIDATFKSSQAEQSRMQANAGAEALGKWSSGLALDVLQTMQNRPDAAYESDGTGASATVTGGKREGEVKAYITSDDGLHVEVATMKPGTDHFAKNGNTIFATYKLGGQMANQLARTGTEHALTVNDLREGLQAPDTQLEQLTLTPTGDMKDQYDVTFSSHTKTYTLSTPFLLDPNNRPTSAELTHPSQLTYANGLAAANINDLQETAYGHQA